MRTRIVTMSLVTLACAWFVPSAWAQQTLSGLSGVVKDTAGMAVAGATVEAASPALIERVRSVVTDGSGQYKITDLQPGVYAVTVRAPGFSTLTQAGVELPAAFVATVNAALCFMVQISAAVCSPRNSTHGEKTVSTGGSSDPP